MLDPSQPTSPILIEGNQQALHLEATLQELPLYSFHIDLECLGIELAAVFEQHPRLPGAILVNQGQFAGMVSRQRLLEYLIRPHGMEIFLNEPLRVLYSYARGQVLLLSGTTLIVSAAHQALRRSPELLSEPILVQTASQAYSLLDVHTLNIAYWQIRGIETQVRYERTQVQMIQSDKMANLGRLVDGVAHEILDPVSFIWGNLSHIVDYSDSLLKLLLAYEAHLTEPPDHVIQLKTDLEFEYLCEDLPRTIDSIRAGAERLSKLATSLQNFCHIDEVYPKPVDLHELIDGILLLLKSRLTSDIQVDKYYGHLPPVLCYAGQINQVFMNILSYSVDAITNRAVSQQLNLNITPDCVSKPTSACKPTISITTQVLSGTQDEGASRWVSICIADNGPGLSSEAQEQILESFSVKKRAEKETSLAVSYQIITAKHGGKFKVRSWGYVEELQTEVQPSIPKMERSNTGTEFEILLPLT